MRSSFIFLLSLGCLLLTFDAVSQHLESLAYRNVGPTRGGRSTAVTGHPAHPGTFYMGTTGGGLWKTNNFGNSWQCISDDYFATGSIGDVAIAPSNPDILVAGTGSDGIRSNIIIGKGIYRSEDAGSTWTSIGLEDAGQIGAVLIHPDDPNIIYVAAIGNPFKNTQTRGVYKSVNGGRDWQQILYHSDSVGAVDLEFAPDDPSVIYASLWHVRRTPWTIISGGMEAGGIFKSSDDGSTWKKMTTGLPSGLIGKSDLATCAAAPDMVWALVEAPEGSGGVYVSSDRGESFKVLSNKKDLVDRPFYFCNIDVNPQNPASIYVSATRFWHSMDGGLSWNRERTPHADNHGMWINPQDTQIYVQCNDGGGTVTRDGGKNWSSINNQPTAELYQVNTDDQFPYWLYAGQQDNSTIAVPSLPPYAYTDNASQLWIAAGGCETGPAVPKPGDPDIVYANCKGRFGVYNKRTGQEQQYYVGAQYMYGHNPKDLDFRFQRVAPILVSPHDPDIIYHTSQYVHQSQDEGKTWNIISPDLTAFTPETQVISGSPITRDITGEEFFSTIYAIEESPISQGVIWTGANDGPVHVTTDGGVHWTNVTPPLPAHGRVQAICASPHDPAKAYVAIYRYLLGDFKPYIFRTKDYGKSWDLLTDGKNGIPGDFPTRVVREDPLKPGLLYAGTEFGMFLSSNDGDTWQSFQQNLPVTPVTDIKCKNNDLVISTMGRSFWIMEDRPLLLQLLSPVQHTALFQPTETIRHRMLATSESSIPHYPRSGMLIHYYLESEPRSDIVLSVYDKEDELICTFDSSIPSEDEEDDKKKEKEQISSHIYNAPSDHLIKKEGMQVFKWDMRYPGITSSSGRNISGPFVPPGKYKITLKVRNKTMSTYATILADPRLQENGISESDLIKQRDLCLKILELQSEIQDAIQKLEKELQDKENEELKSLLYELKTPEGRYQTPKLLDQAGYLYSMLSRADQVPGKDAYERFEVLKEEWKTLKNSSQLKAELAD